MSILAKAKPNQFSLYLDYKTDEVEIEFASLENISQTVPLLYASQQEDVLAIENRFDIGKGYLLTNGTGTGKTFVALGVIKRKVLSGRKNILVVTPNDSMCGGWIKEAHKFDLTMNLLESTTDAGHDLTTTTYANFYQNESLNRRTFDLVVYDESHYLIQNAKGSETVYLARHKHVANLPSVARRKAFGKMGTPPKKIGEDDEMHQWRVAAWKHQMKSHTHEISIETKVLMLSATPFAYHKSIKYADGVLFDIEETIHPKNLADKGYNEAVGFDKFLVDHFGYSMRVNKLTRPDVEIDLDILERNFFEKWREKGVMSTRVLDLEKDYSRHFIKLHSTMGDFIDAGISSFYDDYNQKKYPDLCEFIKGKYTYHYLNQLLETIKAVKVIPRIRKHLSLGRKVIVFHGYKKGLVSHPFKFDAYKMLDKDSKYMAPKLQKQIDGWSAENPDYVNLDLKELGNVIEIFKREFPGLGIINSSVSKANRRTYKEKFFDNDSGMDIMLLQSQAGREGISCHDIRGDKIRVMIDLSLPVVPVEAIQKEGRIYRDGLMSDAIYEYATLQTNAEKIAFSDKIGQRAKTVENLAMGNKARDLEFAFKNGFLNYEDEDPNELQGTGGKEADRYMSEATPFEMSKTLYYARGKKTSKTKSFEGADYFATPEPLGLKMIEWLDPSPGERGLEPSAGHGAIARYFPTNTVNHFIEASTPLFAELGLNSSGNTHRLDFEEFKINNKFEFIAMNPPFGNSGKIAMEHLWKAISGHMYNFSNRGSRLLCIVPNGPAMQKRLDEFYQSSSFQGKFNLTGELILPSVLFKRAGTTVNTKILRIEHMNTRNFEYYEEDLSHCQTIEDFFDEIEHLKF